MSDSTYVIMGRVIDRDTGKGIAKLRVEALDKDLKFDDLVRSTATDRQGNFDKGTDDESAGTVSIGSRSRG